MTAPFLPGDRVIDARGGARRYTVVRVLHDGLVRVRDARGISLLMLAADLVPEAKPMTAQDHADAKADDEFERRRAHRE